MTFQELKDSRSHRPDLREVLSGESLRQLQAAAGGARSPPPWPGYLYAQGELWIACAAGGGYLLPQDLSQRVLPTLEEAEGVLYEGVACERDWALTYVIYPRGHRASNPDDVFYAGYDESCDLSVAGAIRGELTVTKRSLAEEIQALFVEYNVPEGATAYVEGENTVFVHEEARAKPAAPSDHPAPYEVTIEITATRVHVITVQARSPGEAESLAAAFAREAHLLMPPGLAPGVEADYEIEDCGTELVRLSIVKCPPEAAIDDSPIKEEGEERPSPGRPLGR